MSYDYWNKFIKEWSSLPAVERNNAHPIPPSDFIVDWINPNLTPLMNSPFPLDYSLLYIPEPWFGNNGHDVLNSVVINYNPGEAQNNQHFGSIVGLYGCNNYQDLVTNSIIHNLNLVPTINWHYRFRALPIFNSLGRILGAPLRDTHLKNHLSIELIPWHTRNINGINYYITSNLKTIYDHCLVFAAEQSRRIENSKLRNKVIIRVNGEKTIDLLNQLHTIGLTHTIITPITHTNTGNGSYFQFSLKSIKGVIFTSIWGKYSRNNFPPNNDLDYILNHI